MKRSDLIVVSAFYLVCIVMFLMIRELPEEAQTYPTALTIGLALLNTLYFGKRVQLWMRQGLINDLAEIFTGFESRQFCGVLLLCIIYLALMPWIGFYLASLLFLIVAMFFLHVPKIHLALTIIVLAAIIYAVFGLFLKVPLPIGSLWQ